MGFLFGSDGADDTRDDLFPEDYPVMQVDDEARIEEIHEARPDHDAIAVRPHRENDGIDGMDNFLKGIRDRHTSKRGLFRNKRVNVSPHHACEFRYAKPPDAPEERAAHALTLQYVPFVTDPGKFGRFERQLQRFYSDSQIERVEPRFLALSPGDYVAAATLELERYTLFPIANKNLPGFDSDPTGSILQEMAADQGDVDITVQALFRTASTDWMQGVNGGVSRSILRQNLEAPRYETNWRVFTRETLEFEPEEWEKQVAKNISKQSGTGWELAFRVIACGSKAEEVQRRLHNTASMFHNFYELHSEQSFVPSPVGKEELSEALLDATARQWPDVEEPIVKSQSETAGVVNVPTAEEIATSKMRWALSKPGKGVPPGTPRFDYDAFDVEQGTPEAQAAMLAHGQTVSESDGDEDEEVEDEPPFWYGYGAKERTEAGLFPEVLDVHQFVGGGTGKGKTTVLGNFWRQVVTRDRGAMFFDPKGMDAKDFVAMCPELDPEDLVYIELGGDREHTVSMNLMEVPGEAEPGTPAHDSATETLVEDTIAAIAQGSDAQESYWGVRMDRITQNLVRGLSKIGHDATYLDIAFALDPESLEQYADLLADERREWLLRYAETHLVDMDEDKLEPLAGRLQKWIENPMLRELVSSPESTISVDEIVREGKIVVVRDKTSQQNAARLLGSALLRRIWVAIQEQTHDDNHSDPPPFNLVLDEFNDIASTTSNVVTILEEARAFNLSVTAACQDLSGQLPDEILTGIEGQCETFVTYNPGRPDDASLIARQHSEDIEESDLMNISKYRFYMRTHTRNNDLTHSYKVNAFPPAGEVLPDGELLDDDEVEDLIEASLQANGSERRTTQDIKEDSIFLDADDSITLDGEEESTLAGMNPDGRAGDVLAKAVYDTAIREYGETTGTPVDRGVAHDRFARYYGVDSEELATAPFADLVERSRGVDYSTAGGNEHVVATENAPARFMQSGESASAGGMEHRGLLRDAYYLLTRLGLDVSIPTQEGGRDVDGIGSLSEIVQELDADRPLQIARELSEQYPVIAQLTDGDTVTLEAESKTAGKPAQTFRNLAKAVEQDQKCVFLVREDDALTVYRALTDPAFAKRSTADGQTLYNLGTFTLNDGRQPVRPADADQTVWTRRPDGSVICADSNSRELASGDSVAALRAPSADTQWPEVVSEDGEVGEGYRPISDVVSPEALFGSESMWPTPNDWEIVAVPHDAADQEEDSAELLRIAEDGDLVSLVEWCDEESKTTGKRGKAGDEDDLSATLNRLRSEK